MEGALGQRPESRAQRTRRPPGSQLACCVLECWHDLSVCCSSAPQGTGACIWAYGTPMNTTWWQSEPVFNTQNTEKTCSLPPCGGACTEVCRAPWPWPPSQCLGKGGGMDTQFGAGQELRPGFRARLWPWTVIKLLLQNDLTLLGFPRVGSKVGQMVPLKTLYPPGTSECELIWKWELCRCD